MKGFSNYYRRVLAYLLGAVLIIEGSGTASVALAAEYTAEISEVAEAPDTEADPSVTAGESGGRAEAGLSSGSWHWHFSDGVLRYTDDGSSEHEFSEYKDEAVKIIFEAGRYKADDIENCEGLPNLEEVEYRGPVNISGMCFITSGMFKDCPKLKKVTIGSAIEGKGLEIDGDAFNGCTALSEVSFGKGVWHFGNNTFGNCSALTKFVFPEDMHNVRGDSFSGCRGLKELELSDDNPYMRAVKNTIYEINDPYEAIRGSVYETPCLMFVPEGLVKEAGGNYTVIKGTEDIQYWAFYNNKSLLDLTVATTVEGIQLEAFYNCSNLKTIHLPKSLERVGQKAFTITSDNGESLSNITDIYYEGSESQWKEIEFWNYSFDKGHVDRMGVKGTTTLYNHLEDVGIDQNVKVHFNSPIVDTEYDVTDIVNHIKSVKFDSSKIPELKTLGIDLTVKYTDKVTYNGRKHTLKSDKASDKTSNDIELKLIAVDTATGDEIKDTYKPVKVKFKNNTKAAGISGNKAPCLSFQIAGTGLDASKKKALKAVNKKFKSKSYKDTNFCFTIDAADISGFTSENYEGLKIVEKKGKKTAVFKKIALHYKYLGGGEEKSNWILMKPCKKNDPAKKGDYTTIINDDGTVTVNGQHNYKGSVDFKVN
ncbi:MAG: leucine-rich repeat domain-containing protein [Lachnospiraceae bacterium]|nr:leucine-rich repeat domain-containing protein [Lachnospiraceae bacterium]